MPDPGFVLEFSRRPTIPSWNMKSVFSRPTEAEKYSEWDARLLRYDLFWSFYQLGQYISQSGSLWTAALQKEFATRTFIRSVVPIGYRIGEFYANYLLGGFLDYSAGNGMETPTALPVITDNDDIRKSLSKLWRDSRFAVKKDELALHGSIKGDVGIEIRDDPRRGVVWINIWPGENIREIDKDDRGNVTGVTIIQHRKDPGSPFSGHKYSREWAVYAKTIEKMNDGTVQFRTYKDGHIHDWGEGPEDAEGEWAIDSYDFVPFVHIEHKAIGLGWGESELKGAIVSVIELDGISSNIADWLYRSLNGPWLLTGGTVGADLTIPNVTRSELPLYSIGAKEAKLHSMVANMPVDDANNFVTNLIDEIEKSYPELKIDSARASGDMSGKSLREARKPAEKRINSRRAGYDHAIVRSQQMALTIGGVSGYEGYEPWDINSFGRGDLQHQIGQRNVFDLDVFDVNEQRIAELTGIQAAIAAGFRRDDAMRRFGATDEEIKNAMEVEEQEKQREVEVDKAQAGRTAQFTTPPDETQIPERAV